MSTIYFISENKLFSSKTITFKYEVPTNLETTTNTINQIEIPTSNEINKILNKIETKTKEIKLSKPIENVDEIKTQIENNKSKLKPIEDDNYEYIEVTSSQIILEQIKLELQKNPFENLLNSIKNKINEIEKSYTKQIETINKEINDHNLNLEKNKKILIDVELKEIKEIEKEILKKESQLIKINLKKEHLEKSQNNPQNDDKIIKLERKINTLKGLIEDLELEIRIILEQIETFKKKIKIGEEKTINWPLTILTLGLIHWTKYTDNRYLMNKLSIQLSKKKEKILHYELKVKKLEREIENLIGKTKTQNLQNYKQEEKIQLEIEKLDLQITEIEKDIEKLNIKIEHKNKDLEKIEEQIKSNEENIINLQTIKKDLEKNSPDSTQNIINELINNNKNKLKELENISSQLKSQTINISENCQIEL